MKHIILSALLLISISLWAAPGFTLAQLEGTWWSVSDINSPTAAFAIQGNDVWLDHDAQYHPCRIEHDVLVFQLAHGEVRNRIISIKDDLLILENSESKRVWSLTREKSHSLDQLNPQINTDAPAPAPAPAH